MKTHRHHFGEQAANYLTAATLAITLLTIALGSSNAFGADKVKDKPKKDTINVLFMATEGNSAIMKPVTWKIIGPDATTTIEKKQHTFTLDLAYGDYTARLNCNGLNRNRSFKLVSGMSSSNVTIACDK